LGFLCLRYKQRYATAARFYAAAFTAQLKLADDMRSGYRYHAACCAALAAAGQGSDADQLSPKEKAQWREQALSWLWADLALRALQVQSDNPPDRQTAQQALKHWQKDPDLAALRDQGSLAKLPEAERKEWAKLWDEVAALLKKAGPKP
jgi:hypothetical protein